MRIVKEKRGQFIIIAALLIAIMMVSVSTIMYGAVTYYRHERWEEYLTIIDNVEIGSRRVVEISLADYTSTMNNEILRNNLNQWVTDVKKAYAGFGVTLSYDTSGTATSGQTLYAHQETTTINGPPYYLQKIESADTSGISLSTSMTSIGRQLWGRFVYQLTDVSSIPASTWTFYYRTWHSLVPSDLSTNSPSSTPAGTWTNPTYGYSSDDLYATTLTDKATQQYGNYGFSIPSGAIITKVEVGFEAYTEQNEKIGITCSWDGGTNWATEQTSSILPNSDPDAVTWMDFTGATSWTIDKLSNANFRTRAKGVKQDVMKTVYLDWIPVRVTYSVPPSAHADVDLLIRKSDGTIRWTIASDAANSETLTTTAQTLSGTYSWDAHTVIDQTDYLEIDFYVDIETAKSGVTAYLRIDDSTLAIADQTRTTNVMLPSDGGDEEGLTIDWYEQESSSTANVTFTIDITAVGLKGYKFFAPVFLRMRILDILWDNQEKELTVSLVVDKEDLTPVTNLEKENFSILVDEEPKDLDSLVYYYNETYDCFIYEICSTGPTPPSLVSVTAIDTRSIRVIANLTLAPPPMHVGDISMWYAKEGPWYTVYTKVPILDEIGQTVSDATVYLNTTLPDGSVQSFSEKTGSDGTVTFSLKSKLTGTYTSTVTDVVKDGCTYDPASNVETSESLTVS